MDRPETISLLRNAHDEVVTLRRRVAELEPKAHAYDTLAIIARQSVHEESQSYGVDVAWRLKLAVEALVAERAASGMSAGTPETRSGSGLQPASPVGEAETPKPPSE